MSSRRHDRLADWFREWHAPLRRFLLRAKGSPPDVDDIVQEVFLRLLRYDRSDLVDQPQAYLFRCAANVSAEWATRSSRRSRSSAEWLDELVDATNPEERLDRKSAEGVLKRAICALPPRPREVLRLRFAEGLPHEAIADRLNLTKRMVKRDLVRAYAELRETLVTDQFNLLELLASLDGNEGLL